MNLQISTNLSVSTIFKTIPSDVNKSGKAFEILGKKASDLKTAFDNAGGGVKGFRSALAELTKKDFKLNDAGEIITKDNIDSFLPQISDNRVDKLAKSIVKISKGKGSWDQFYKKFENENEKDYIKDLIKNTEDLSKVTGEDLTKACNSARQSILDHNAALQQQTIGAKAAAVGMNLLKTALNSIAYMAIIQAVISFANTIITKFDDIVNAYQNGICNSARKIKIRHGKSRKKPKNYDKMVGKNELQYEKACKFLNKRAKGGCKKTPPFITTKYYNLIFYFALLETLPIPYILDIRFTSFKVILFFLAVSSKDSPSDKSKKTLVGSKSVFCELCKYGSLSFECGIYKLFPLYCSSNVVNAPAPIKSKISSVRLPLNG